jgi:hypothetical protein
MTTSSSRENKKDVFAQRYRAALCRYLKQDGRTKPTSAAKLGRDAVALEMETLDLAIIHEQAVMSQAVAAMSVAARDRLLRQAAKLFTEVLVPI